MEINNSFPFFFILGDSMRVIIEIKNLTDKKYKTLKTYSNSAMEFIEHIKTVDKTEPIENIGFYLKRVEQALKYILGVVNTIEPNE